MKKIKAGIDIGSRTVKFVLTENRKIKYYEVVDNGFNTSEICNRFLKNHNYDSIIATGYGRTLLEIKNNIPTVSEIKAFAVGISNLMKDDSVILDIGGQDTKFIKVKNNKVIKFEMNDRCAAGTGKFFEIMAKTLGYTIKDFSNISAKEVNVTISSMCAVFAESEVTSLLSKGINRETIVVALHKSIIKRIIGKLQSFVTSGEKVVFCGGCAHNKLLKDLLELNLKREIIIPPNPQIIGAYGASLLC